MSVTININNLSLCHKGSNGISTATVPDVCKTPSPGGPVPVPYPNIAMSSDLVEGTTTVEADGGNMCANYGSQFSKSTGDEPGTVGGVVSGTFIKEASWITFSFDVKLEGKGACRLTDKMFHNHQNTVNMGGLLQEILALIKVDPDKGCEKLLDYIEQLVGEGKTGKQGGIRGLFERFQQQITGGGFGPLGAPNAPFDRPPNPDFPNGSNSWMRHNKAIQDQQKALDEALDQYDDKCKGQPPPPASAREWADKKLPEASEWKGPVYATEAASSGVNWGRVGWGALAVGLTAVVIAGLFFPPNWPAEPEEGAGAAAAWALAFGL
jgi:hypothetical protein